MEGDAGYPQNESAATLTLLYIYTFETVDFF